MRRIHPLFSPTSLFFSILIIGGVLVTAWLSGGWMFSPGKLTAKAAFGSMTGGIQSHAAIEKECSFCHQPLKTNQGELCLTCHVQIGEQIDAQVGLHAALPQVMTCYACHSDHRGRAFDPTSDARARIDHAITGFSLIHHQVNYDITPISCGECHDPHTNDFLPSACFDCHQQDAVFDIENHTARFGRDCLACHDGVDRMVGFDHTATNFPLEGAHADASCAACHRDVDFTSMNTSCVGCHVEPDIHANLFGMDCAACHTTMVWSPALLDDRLFNHAETRFTLLTHSTNFLGGMIRCVDCHQEGIGLPFQTGLCVACHQAADRAFMEGHIQTFGLDCIACHDGSGRLANFNHDQVFPLTGAHLDLDCATCHANQVFQGTPASCAGCHEEPPIHAGAFGLDCERCHTTDAWRPARLVSHTFPLDHGDEGEIPCQTCHVTTYITYTCDACHEPAEMREEHNKEGIMDLANCAGCHPTGTEDEAEDD